MRLARDSLRLVITDPHHRLAGEMDLDREGGVRGIRSRCGGGEGLGE